MKSEIIKTDNILLRKVTRVKNITYIITEPVENNISLRALAKGTTNKNK